MADSLPRRRRQGKLKRSLASLEVWAKELHPSYEEYVRLHRLLYDCDPDPEDVSNEREEEE